MPDELSQSQRCLYASTRHRLCRKLECKIHFIPWNEDCLPLDNSSLGIMDLRRWSAVLCAKTAARFLSCNGSLLVSTLFSKCGGRGDLFLPQRKDSWPWKLICLGGPIANENSICSGEKCRLLEDKWVCKFPFNAWPTFINIDFFSNKVSCLLNLDGSQNAAAVNQDFSSKLAIRVFTLNREHPGEVDLLVWHRTKKMKAPNAANYASTWGSLKLNGSWCWTVDTQPHLKALMLRICNSFVAFDEWFSRRSMGGNCNCVRGCMIHETFEQVFFNVSLLWRYEGSFYLSWALIQGTLTSQGYFHS